MKRWCGYHPRVNWTQAIALLEIVYFVVLAVWIVREKRHPLATLSWLLALALLPVAGFGIYWLLGPRRIGRERSRRAQALRRIRASMPDLRALFEPAPDATSEKLDPLEKQLIALALNNSESPVSTGNLVRVLRNGRDCFDALEAAIRTARQHVHFEYYLMNDDGTGRRFRDLLATKAREGVRVRLLVDAVGSISLGDAFFAPIVEAGGEVAVFNPLRLARLRPLNFRNHRKIVVVDGQVAFTGGINVGDEYLGLGPHGAWRDTHLRIEGPGALALQQLFLEDWQYATGRSFAADALFDAPSDPHGSTLVQVVGSAPGQPWPSIPQLLLVAIAGATRRITISTPYFVPDEATFSALTTAALRGVDVHILLPRRSDSRLVLAAGRSYYDELIRAGVRIYEYLPGFLHAKTVVIDGTCAFVGSANFDQRSFRLNLEVVALLFGNEVARELDAQFDQDLTLAREVRAEDRAHQSRWEALWESFARVFSPLL